MIRSVANLLRQVETICALLLLSLIVILVVAASIARAMGNPIIWSIEVAQLLFVWLCMISADLALQSQRHFGLSVLSDAIAPGAQRWLEFVNRLVLIGLLGFLLVYAVRNTILMHPRLEGATQMHGSYIHGSMVVGLALLLRTMIAQALAILRGETEKNQPGEVI